MSTPVALRGDFGAGEVRAAARHCKDAAQVRRLLAIATILDGGSRSEAAEVSGVTLQIIRDWVLRFNEAGLDGLATCKAPVRRQFSAMTTAARWRRSSLRVRSRRYTA